MELQPQRKAYQFFDASWPEQLAYFPAAHGVACIYRDEPLPEYTASGLRINVRTPPTSMRPWKRAAALRPTPSTNCSA